MSTTSFNSVLHRYNNGALWVPLLIGAGLMGGVNLLPRIVLLAFASATFLLLALLQFRRARSIRLDGVALIGLLMLAVTLFQLMPLPDAWLEWLSPTAMQHVQATRALGIEVPARISLDPTATMQSAMLIATALLFYLVAFHKSFFDTSAEETLSIVGYTGALVALASLAHYFTGATAIWGKLLPENVDPEIYKVTSLFVNPNNAAGFFNLTGFVLLGVWRKADRAKPRGIIFLGSLVCFATSALMLSRGGLIALAFGGMMLVILSRFSGNRRMAPSPVATLLELGLAAALAVAFIAVFNVVLSTTSGEKFVIPFANEEVKSRLWSAAVPLVDQFHRIGAGAGAFGDAISPLNTLSTQATFLHAENELLELLVEYGTLFGLLFMAGGAVVMIRRVGFARARPMYREAVVGVAALAIQNMVDFSIRIPLVAIAAAIVVGAVSGSYAKEYVKQKNWLVSFSPLKVIPVAAAAWIVVVAASLWIARNDSQAAYASLKALHGSQVPADAAHRAYIAPALALNPADSHMLTLASNYWAGTGETERALQAAERAAFLCPACVPPKASKAGILLAAGKTDDAVTLLRQIATLDKRTEPAIFLIVQGAKVPPERLGELWGDDHSLILRMANHLRTDGTPDLAERLLLAAQSKHGWEPSLMATLASLYLAEGHHDRVDELSTYMLGYFPDSHIGYLYQARVSVIKGDMELAMALYEEALAKITQDTESVSVGLEMLNLLANLRRWDRFDAIAPDIRKKTSSYPRLRSQFHTIIARREEMRQRFQAALSELELADTAYPLDDRIAMRKAAIYKKTGDNDKAAMEYRKALRINPGNGPAATALQELEASADRAMSLSDHSPVGTIHK